MSNHRQRPVFMAVAAIAFVWVMVFAGNAIINHLKVTPEKVRDYMTATDFAALSAAEKARAIQRLSDMLNALSLEERQQLRFEGTTFSWFKVMTEDEKSQFLEATMPTGFKKMIGAFEELPEEQRRKTVSVAMRQLKEDRERVGEKGTNSLNPTNQIVLSKDLQDKVTKIGLQTFYSQSSPQTKAELAPLLEEMQKTMQGGMLLHGGPPKP